MTSVLTSLKQASARVATSNIWLYAFVRLYLCRLRLFLPHEADYAAVKLLPIGDGLFLDVGANDGLSALSFRVFNKTARILSIEPNPHHVPALEKLKRRLRFFDYMIVGAGAVESSVTLFTPVYKGFPLTSYASLSEEMARQNLAENVLLQNVTEMVSFSRTTVRIRPLDDLGVSPALIKIDVEGFEDSVIRGLATTLGRCRPALMIEYNPRSFCSVRTLAEGHGYQAVFYDASRRRFIRYANQRALNVFFLHPDRVDVTRIGEV